MTAQPPPPTADDVSAIPAFPFCRGIMDPPEEYERFRGREGLAKVRLWDGSVAWLATRYDDVRAILADNRFSADAARHGYPTLSEARAAFVKNEPPLFIRMDPPRHGELRRMLTREFTYSRVQTMRSMIEAIVDTLTSKLLDGPNPTDFFEHFALPLPSIVISGILGFPYEDHDFFQERSSKKISLGTAPHDAVEANRELRDYVLTVIREKERNPEAHDDLLGRLIIEQIRPGKLNYADAVGLVELLLQAGHETTANMTTMGLLTLIQNPAAFAVLRDQSSPEIIRSAVEEMLRYQTIVQFVGARVAREDVEIAGETIRAGEGMLAMIDAANRDSARFPAPDTFEIGRPEMPPHVAFGFGIHQCLGQQLARLEMEVVFSSLPSRMPTLKLAVPETALRFKRNVLVHGLEELPITW